MSQDSPILNFSDKIRAARIALSEADLIRARQLLEEILLQFPDDSHARNLLVDVTRQEVNRRHQGQALQLHVCARVGRYRNLARKLVQSEDTVIEIGAAEGHTTQLLARRARCVIAVDISAECIRLAQERCAKYDNIDWVVGDGFETERIMSYTPVADWVFIDVGGSTWATIALRLSATCRTVFRPRGIVIRNVNLNDFVVAVQSAEEDAKPGAWQCPFGV